MKRRISLGLKKFSLFSILLICSNIDIPKTSEVAL